MTAPATITTSRPITKAVSPYGVSPVYVSAQNVLTSSSLSAAGSSRPPKRVRQSNFFARNPSSPSDNPATTNTPSAAA